MLEGQALKNGAACFAEVHYVPEFAAQRTDCGTGAIVRSLDRGDER